MKVANVRDIQSHVGIGYSYVRSSINISPLLRGLLNHKNIYIRKEQNMYRFRVPPIIRSLGIS